MSTREEQAAAHGWKPQEEWKGDPDKWVDADTFMERAETFVPFLKKDRERLEGELGTLRNELQSTKALLAESREAIEALKDFHSEDAKRRVAAARVEVQERLAQASEDGDHKAVAKLTDQLIELKEAEKSTKQEERKAPPSQDASQTAWFQSWHASNQWYGSDQIKTAIANAVALRLRQAGDSSREGAFMTKVTAETEKELAKLRGDAPLSASKVEGSGGQPSAGGKRFVDLPAEAKEYCKKMSAKLVGPGRAYKDEKAWQDAYATKFFEE